MKWSNSDVYRDYPYDLICLRGNNNNIINRTIASFNLADISYCLLNVHKNNYSKNGFRFIYDKHNLHEVTAGVLKNDWVI